MVLRMRMTEHVLVYTFLGSEPRQVHYPLSLSLLLFFLI